MESKDLFFKIQLLRDVFRPLYILRSLKNIIENARKFTNNFRSHIHGDLIGNLYYSNTLHLCYILWKAFSGVLRHVCVETVSFIPNTHTLKYSFSQNGED